MKKVIIALILCAFPAYASCKFDQKYLEIRGGCLIELKQDCKRNAGDPDACYAAHRHLCKLRAEAQTGCPG